MAIVVFSTPRHARRPDRQGRFEGCANNTIHTATHPKVRHVESPAPQPACIVRLHMRMGSYYRIQAAIQKPTHGDLFGRLFRMEI